MLTPLMLIALCAHDLEVTANRIQHAGAETVVVIRAAYAGADAAAFAKVQVFDPQGQEFQAANADKRGYFSFVPASAGAWRVVVDDELGHRREIAVPVAGTGTTEPPSASAPSRIERTLLGLSLIAAATGFWYGYSARRPASTAESPSPETPAQRP